MQESEVLELGGLGVSPGLVAGPLLFMPPDLEKPDQTRSEDADREIYQLGLASEQTARDLSSRALELEGEMAKIIRTQALMARDSLLQKLARSLILQRGWTAARAVWEASETLAQKLGNLGGYSAERGADVVDVGRRIAARLLGKPAPGLPEYPEPFVLAALDLAPADASAIDPKKILALITEKGSAQSHTAIIARSLGLPAVVGLEGVYRLKPEQKVLVDGRLGRVVLNPSPAQMSELRRYKKLRRHIKPFSGRGETADGRPIELLANVGSAQEAARAKAAKAEGIGLLRTEFLYLDRDTEPDLDEQTRQYSEIFGYFPGRKVVIRTLDAGSDKPLRFLPKVLEPNPALGIRGWRINRLNPEFIAKQLEAIALAQSQTRAEVWVMPPMITLVGEFLDFSNLAQSFGLKTLGAMIETPAAALRAEKILLSADFLSLGANDLAQYLFAADRLLADLEELNRPWQPVLLEQIFRVAQAGKRAGKPVGVCGEAAADPALAVVLAGAGISSLSMSVSALDSVAYLLASVSLDKAQELARLALEADSAARAKDLVSAALPGLARLGLA